MAMLAEKYASEGRTDSVSYTHLAVKETVVTHDIYNIHTEGYKHSESRFAVAHTY